MSTGGGTATAVDDAWARHRRYDRVADRSRARLEAARRANLVLLGVGALLGATAAQSGLPDLLQRTTAALAALVLVVAGVVQRRVLQGDLARRWTASRAASEAIKAEVHRRLAGVAPYASADRDARLAEKVAAIAEDAAALDRVVRDVTADDEPVPEIGDVASYTTVRALEQANWHGDKIGEHEQRARRLRLLELVATLAAAAITAAGALAGAGDLGLWVGVATTVGAAISAHLDATRHDQIAGLYSTTERRLREQIARHERAEQPDAARFVDAIEDVLARQNESWVGLLGGIQPRE
ncbi:MAG: DUF4231 domain-containing protein [Actinomycetota bacterium]